MSDAYDSGWVGADAADDLDRRLALEDASESFDLRQPYIMTMLGPIDPAALGVTVAGGQPVAVSGSDAAVSGALEVALAELELFHAAGGRAIVVMPPIDDEAATSTARWVAARSPVHLVVAAASDAPVEARTLDEAEVELATRLERQLMGEAEPHDPRAGAIGIRVGPDRAAGTEAWRLGAVADAHRVSGAPVVLYGPGTDPVDGDLLQRLLDIGVRGERILVRAPGTPDDGWANRVLDAGVTIAMSQNTTPIAPTNPVLAMSIARLIADGWGGQLMLGDATSHHWNDILARLPLDLMEAGCDAPAVRRLLVDNPARLLARVGGERDTE